MTKEEKELLREQLMYKNKGYITFTAKEVCNTLRISRAKLSRLQKSAGIEFCKSGGVNGAVTFTVNSLINYIESQTIVSYGGTEWKKI